MARKSPWSEEVHDTKMRTRRLLSELVVTPDEELATFRKRRIAWESTLEPERLREVRELLDMLGAALHTTDDDTWAAIHKAWTDLCWDGTSTGNAASTNERTATSSNAQPVAGDSARKSPAEPDWIGPLAGQHGAPVPAAQPRSDAPPPGSEPPLSPVVAAAVAPAPPIMPAAVRATPPPIMPAAVRATPPPIMPAAVRATPPPPALATDGGARAATAASPWARSEQPTPADSASPTVPEEPTAAAPRIGVVTAVGTTAARKFSALPFRPTTAIPATAAKQDGASAAGAPDPRRTVNADAAIRLAMPVLPFRAQPPSEGEDPTAGPAVAAGASTLPTPEPEGSSPASSADGRASSPSTPPPPTPPPSTPPPPPPHPPPPRARQAPRHRARSP